MAQYKNRDVLLKTAEIDPQFAELLKSIGPITLPFDNILKFREMVDSANEPIKAALATPELSPPTIKASDVSYTTRDGANVACRLVQPTNGDGKSPLVVLIHGGGFSSGAPIVTEPSARILTMTYNAVCVNITHRLAPEHPFPVAVNDIHDAIIWARDNAASWGADLSAGFILTGISAGGNLAAVGTVLSRHEKVQPPVTGTLLNIPQIFHPHVGPPDRLRDGYLSYEQNKDAPLLSQAACEMVLRAYKPVEGDWRNTPLDYPGGLKQLDLPKTVVMVAGLDPLRDDGILYERVLREELGVKTKLYMYEGVPHGHNMFPMLEKAKKQEKDFVEAVGWLLEKNAA